VQDYENTIPSKIKERTKEVVSHYAQVALNVRYVQVSRTMDTNDYVIKLISADGKEASLWLDSDGFVRSISEY
jgi:hypothetical protein